jgi:hypothetical protein
MRGRTVSLMKSTLSDCESTWLKESASIAQLWNAPSARFAQFVSVGGLLRSTEVVLQRPAIVH